MGGSADEPHCRYTDGGRGGHLRSEQDTKVRGVLNGKINDTNAFCIWRKRCVHIEVSWGFPGGRAGGCYLVGGRRNGVQGVGGWSGREARPTLYIPSTGTIQDDQMGMGVQSVDARGTPALHRPCITNQWQWVSDGQSFGAFAVSLSSPREGWITGHQWMMLRLTLQGWGEMQALLPVMELLKGVVVCFHPDGGCYVLGARTAG